MPSSRESLRLLILEDQEMDAKLAIAQLKEGGFDVTSRRVATEKEFRHALAVFAPQVVLSDFSLPGFDGMTALQITRSVAPQLPFIFLSGTIGEERAVDALRHGATDYVLKSNTVRLVPAVRRALRDSERDLRHEAAQQRLVANERELRRLLRTLDYLGLPPPNPPAEADGSLATIDLHPEDEEGLIESLRVALDEEQFTVLYQPLVSVEQGFVEGAEALLRWEHPDHGLLTPNHFLPALERSGLIVPVGQWVLEQIVQDMRYLHTRGIASLRISANVSALQMRRASFTKQLIGLLRELPSEAFRLDLEVTESLFIRDAKTISAHLQTLRDAGIHIALDDFGTGYSSLALLPQLPLDILKIDRSFVAGLPGEIASSTLVTSIMGLAHAFHLNVVAEGVETKEQLAALRLFKCPYAQGYLFGQPMFLDRLSAHLLSQRC